MSSVKVCASSVHVRCMIDAWTSTHWAKCVKHTYNNQNMINMHNHGNPQKLVLIKVQKSEKNTIEAFYQTLKVHTYYTCMLNNAWTYENLPLNTYYFCHNHNGPTSKANRHLKQNSIKKIDKK